MLSGLKKEFPGSFAVIYRHVPLDYHKRAYAAARASECAGAQGRFEAYHDALFANGDMLDTISFDRLARGVDMPDMKAFSACAARTDPVPAIDRDKALGLDSLKISGTPTVAMNGKLYPFAPPMAELRAILKKASEARSR